MIRIAYSILVASCAALLFSSAAAAKAPVVIETPVGFGVAVDAEIALAEGTVDVSVTARASASCADGRVCFWTQTDYDGSKGTADADEAMTDRLLTIYDESAKNRFGQRKVQIKDAGLDVVQCLNPGDSDPSLHSQAAYFRIGSVGSSC